jgi:polyketide biosynthesis enoyl-CoA hydratase PksI
MNPADLFAVDTVDECISCLHIATDQDQYMGPLWVEGFTQALDRLGKNAQLRAVVLVGGKRVFSLGASREALLAAGNEETGVAEYAARAAHALLNLPVPVVAALEGHAVGGGLLIGLWSDALFMAEESLYGANFISLGFTPGMGATWAVQEAFGAALGREMLLTGRLLTGKSIRALGCPLSHAVRPRELVRETTLALAREIADAPRPALVLLKRTLSQPRMEALKRALAAEHGDHTRLFSDPQTFREIADRYPSPVEGAD